MIKNLFLKFFKVDVRYNIKISFEFWIYIRVRYI